MYTFLVLFVLFLIVFSGILITQKRHKKKATRKMILQHPTHAGCVAFKIENGITKVLLVTARDKTFVWVLPKGRIERKESARKAALRELEEEASLKGRFIKNIGTVERKKQDGQTIITQYFLVEITAPPSEVESPEGRLIKWLPLHEAIELATHQDTKEILGKI